MCIELGRIAQGYKDTEGTNTVKFMNLDEIANIPADRTVTYARIVVDYYRPQKADPNRVRITAGGNLINYPYELTTRTADLTTSKTSPGRVVRRLPIGAVVGGSKPTCGRRAFAAATRDPRE